MQGITVIPYPDDLLLKAPSPVQLHQHVFETCPFLLQHWWMLNFQKSQLVLSQRLLFLGFRILPNRRFFSPGRQNKVTSTSGSPGSRYPSRIRSPVRPVCSEKWSPLSRHTIRQVPFTDFSAEPPHNGQIHTCR